MENKTVILVSVPPDRFHPEHKEILARSAQGREIVYFTDRAEIEKILDRIEICIGFGPWDLLARMPRLAWFQSWSAGVDGYIMNPELNEHPVIISNTLGIHKEQLTEHIFALILSWSRRFPKAFVSQKKHEWSKLIDVDVPVIAGKTMLILGYGSIGEYCAKAALSFSMKVIGLRRNPSAAVPGIRVETTEKLHALLPEADFVVNILPLTHDTRNFMGHDEFSLMKQSCVYVNVGRGPTTDEDALIEALRNGKIAGALLDVTAQEPLPKDSPLWDMDNVILTSHYAGLRPDYSSKAMEITIENLGRYNRGEALINRIDKTAGY
jgi:phosphoglycerate dehydrogenase-like enzyme